ncbi:hypothetical protein PR048_015834 [Dryococelus australis]|uniref:Uncharacterized protein n=1 Tax=Dryococelus australis TaxID=614101 RepID=A0ABQ9HI16_9NEOP|nr:hypothetical protein PR048_015834 [Dryococelus australis]
MRGVCLLSHCEKKKHRRWDAHLINCTPYVDGAFPNLLGILREKNEKFVNYIVMSVTLFDEQDIVQGIAFYTQELLSFILRERERERERESESIFSQFSTEFCHENAKCFKKKAHLPHCLRAMEGKHVRNTNPEHSGSLCYNHRHFFSEGLLAVAASIYKFLYSDVDSIEKAAGQTTLYDRTFGKALADGSLDIPQPDTVSPELESLSYVFVFLGDALGIYVNLLRPYPRTHLTRKQKSLDY